MPQDLSLKIPLERIDDSAWIQQQIAQKLSVNPVRVSSYQMLRQSIDARRRPPSYQVSLRAFIEEPFVDAFSFEPRWQDVSSKPPVHIIGTGPAGLFAAMRCIESGLRPILFDRGKDVRLRRRDLAAMNKQGIVNPESNYCYGEGGAGTYSDGKLYTRSKKRGDIVYALQIFRYFGAAENILHEAHPHIGTNKLPGIIQSMSEHIRDMGGEIHFDSKLTELEIRDGALHAITIDGDETEDCSRLILATGHSARDIFTLLDRNKIEILAKPFALGVRVEHPQSLIDEIQYHCSPGDPALDILGAASYSLVSQEGGRGVFSFCMCPGGIIAPASTEEGALVVNGWSPSRRDGRYANSGVVVTVDEEDFGKYGYLGTLAGMRYQQMVEEAAWKLGGGRLVAPAQRLTDFCEGRMSATLPDCSYLPGVRSAMLSEVLPVEVYASLSSGLRSFGQKMKGYYTEEAIVTATESRTSSPVRIPRDRDTLQHTQVAGLYPCGEGAGYAGGIISAALDGMRVVDAMSREVYGDV